MKTARKLETCPETEELFALLDELRSAYDSAQKSRQAVRVERLRQTMIAVARQIDRLNPTVAPERLAS